MARFRFQLAKLRRLREIARDERRVRLAEAYRAQDVLADQTSMVASEIEMSQLQQRKLIETGAPDVNQILEAQRHQLALESQRETMLRQTADLDAEIELRRQALIEADRQVRVLDRLEERRREEHQRDERLLEVKQLDDAAGRRFGGLA